MKCPQCNYVSFDGLYNCKKCGFVFTRQGSGEAGEDINSLLLQTDSEGRVKSREDEPSNVQQAVASIRDSLDEIEGKDHGHNEEVSQDRPIQIETDELKLRIDDEYIEKSKQFPDPSEINWEESVPLSSNEINLGTHDGTAHDSKETSDVQETAVPYTETEDFKAEIRKIGEKLQQIEEHPSQPEQLDSVSVTTQDFDISQVKKGGFWIRVAATIIDNIILYMLAGILSAVGMIALGMGSAGLEALDEDSMFQLLGPLYLFNTIITIVYYTYFHGNTGQTPGKMLCKIKVVNLKGERLGYPRSFLRWVGYIISSFVFCLGFLWVVWDRNKQGWHDKMAGSYVISTK